MRRISQALFQPVQELVQYILRRFRYYRARTKNSERAGFVKKIIVLLRNDAAYYHENIVAFILF